jgi:PPOX class probable F420-dependent enzyme
MSAVSGWRTRLRAVENALVRVVRDSEAAREEQAALPWDAAALAEHEYLLLVSRRRSGEAVPTPVWFAVAGALVYVRSGASDGKIKRIRRDSRVTVAPCTFRGRRTGPAMRGRARLLPAAEEAAAEWALRRRYGLRRRIYAALRDPALETAFLEIRGDDG